MLGQHKPIDSADLKKCEREKMLERIQSSGHVLLKLLCRPLFSAIVGLACLSVDAQIPDRVISTDGPEGTVSGKVIAVTPGGVDVEDKAGTSKNVPVEKIREIQFAGEPASLKTARSMLARRRPADALKELAKIEPSELEGAEPLIVAEVEFVKAAAAGRAAIDSGGSPVDAGKQVNEFLKKHSESFHFYQMQELLGDLLGSAGKWELAQDAYAKLAKGPASWKVRAAAARATMLFNQKKYDEAYKEFQSAIKIDAGDEISLAQKRGAELGMAKCLTQQGKQADAINMVQKIIKQSNPEEKELLGKAYNVLGEAYRSTGGKDQDALISFLTVDLVYNSLPESHAEALFYLCELWERGKNPERAREAKQNLESTYPNSSWAKKVVAAKS